MEIVIVKNSTLLCISLSLVLLTPSLSLEANVENNPSVPSLPRKLKVIQEQATKTQESSESKMKARGTIDTGVLQHKEVAINKTNNKQEKGEDREWEEEIVDPSELLTMDYHNVRRRRPIHNESLPVGP